MAHNVNHVDSDDMRTFKQRLINFTAFMRGVAQTYNVDVPPEVEKFAAYPPELVLTHMGAELEKRLDDIVAMRVPDAYSQVYAAMEDHERNKLWRYMEYFLRVTGVSNVTLVDL